MHKAKRRAHSPRHGRFSCFRPRRCAARRRMCRSPMALRATMTAACLSGIIFVIRHGLRWRDAPAA